MQGRTTLNTAAIALTLAISVVGTLVSGIFLQAHSHESLSVLAAPVEGTARVVEDVWKDFGCQSGTERLDPSLDGTITFDPKIIQRVGTCKLDYKDVKDPSYFFQAESPKALSDWLQSGDLSVDPALDASFRIYRDGAVAILNTDGQASYAIPSRFLALPIAGDEYSQELYKDQRADADEHGRVDIDQVPVVGDAQTIEAVWSEWGACRSGTETVPATTSGIFEFEPSQITRVGSCVMDDETDFPTYFFQAPSASGLSQWLRARDLHVVDGTKSTAARYGQIYRDGAVAIVTGSGDAIYRIPDDYQAIGKVP